MKAKAHSGLAMAFGAQRMAPASGEGVSSELRVLTLDPLRFHLLSGMVSGMAKTFSTLHFSEYPPAQASAA
jgi:hypothetical protein